ncbi:MAG: hypothetical protein AAGJ35_14300, partial [Myxococcota bacterium]
CTLQQALQQHPDTVVHEWLHATTPHPPQRPDYARLPFTTTPHTLSPQQRKDIRAQREHAEALELVYHAPTSGLCKALQKLKHPTPQPEICAALLCCHDPIEQTAQQWCRFAGSSEHFLHNVHTLITTRCTTQHRLGALGQIWMFAWDAHRAKLQHQLQEQPHTFCDFLLESLKLPHAILRTKAWQAALHILKVSRWQRHQALDAFFTPQTQQLLLAVLTLGKTHLPLLIKPDRYDRTLQELAAEMLRVLLHTQPHTPHSRQLQIRLFEHLHQLPQHVRSTLHNWLHSQGLPLLNLPPPSIHSSNIDALLHVIQQKHTPKALRPFCLEQDLRLFEAAMSRLIDLGEAGQSILAELLLDPSPKLSLHQLRILGKDT